MKFFRTMTYCTLFDLNSPRKSDELGEKPEATAARCPKCSGCLRNAGVGMRCAREATATEAEAGVVAEAALLLGARMLSIVNTEDGTCCDLEGGLPGVRFSTGSRWK